MNKIIKNLLVFSAVFLLVFAVKINAAFAGTPQVISAKIMSPTIIEIIFTEPVITSMADYGDLVEGIYGRTLLSVAGSGTAKVTLSFKGEPFKYDASGRLSIAKTTVSASDNMPFLNGSVGISDGQIPKLLSFNIGLNSNNRGESLANASDSVSLSFTTTKNVETPKIVVDGRTILPVGSGTGLFTVNYNKQSGDARGSVPYSITISDKGGNPSSYYGTLTFIDKAVEAGAPPALAKYQFTKLLKLGMKEQEVTELQKLLSVLGFFAGEPTGKFDARTVAAVKAYQKAKGIAALGHVGPATRTALNE